MEKAGTLAKKRSPLPPVQGKVATAPYMDEEWRDLLTSFNWRPYSSGEAGGASWQRWFHPNSELEISINYPKDDEPYFVVLDRKADKELVRGQDTYSLKAYAEPESKEKPVEHGKEPEGQKDLDFMKGMGIKWSGLLGPCFKPVMSALYTVEDLDEYDSQIAHDLMALHDEIIDAPVRGVVPDYGDSYQGQALYNFTLNALKSRLLPAVTKAIRRLPKSLWKEPGRPRDAVMKLVNEAIAKIVDSEEESDMKGLQRGGMAGIYLEEAFMKLHQAIEIIRDATRERGM